MDRKTGLRLQTGTGVNPFNEAYRTNLRPTRMQMALGSLAVLRRYPAMSRFKLSRRRRVVFKYNIKMNKTYTSPNTTILCCINLNNGD